MRAPSPAPLALVLASLFAHATATATATAPAATESFAFVHASVIPMDEERVLADQTVVVAGGRIVSVGPSATASVPDDARIVDASGGFLLPAFCDMHVHLLGEGWNMMLPEEERLAREDVPWDRFLFPYVANGVTTLQELFGLPEHLALRDRIERGEILGPRLIVARMMDAPEIAWPPPLGVWVDSPEAAREAVLQAKQDGYDKIKVYSFLDRPTYDAIVETSEQVGLDVIGHIPLSISIEHAVESGQTLIAHSEEVAKHVGPKRVRRRIEQVSTLLVERGVWMAPTLITTRSILEVFDDPHGLASRPEAAFYRHPMEQGVWAFVLERLYEPIPTAGQDMLRHDFEKVQKPLVAAFHRKGGRLLAGSDTVLPGLVPGFALHRELQELVAVGLTPFEAIRTSTTAPFDYLGERDHAGTVAPGQRAELVLLRANPLDDISRTADIAGVLTRGRWIDAQEIHDRMQHLADPSTHLDVR